MIRNVCFCLVWLVAMGLFGCQKMSKTNKKQTPLKRIVKKPLPQKATFSAHWFRSPKQAFKMVLGNQPTILGIGEIHQVQSQRHIPSAIRRFTHELLGSLWGVSTDLIVETWVTTGQCGHHEVKMTKQIRTMTKRPKKTESQIVKLLKQAKNIGIQPHILAVHCKTYQNLMKETGSTRTRQLILLVTRLLLQKTRAVFEARRRKKQKANIVIYGGALHNDLYPEPALAHFSYVPKLLKQIKKTPKMRFVELDLYVPEYLNDDKEWKEKPWYPLFLKQQKTSKTLLIKRKKNSYILVLPWTQNKTKRTQLKPPARR